jgi:protein O-GlcNAc transferase
MTQLTPSETASQKLEEGLTFHQRGDYARAIQVYNDLLAFQPGYPDALHLLGEISYRQGQYDKALAYVNHAIAGTVHHFYLNTRGMVFLELGYLMEAEQDLKRAIKLVPNYLEAHINLSNVFRKKKDFKNARKFAELSLKIDSNSAGALNTLGSVQMESGQLDAALITFDQVLTIAPNTWAAMKNKAKIWVVQKKWQEALPLLEKAMPMQDFEVGVMLSRAYSILGHAEKAIDPFKAAFFSSSYESRKNYFEAEDSITQLFAVCEALGTYRSNYADIAQIYQLAVEVLPEHTSLLNNLAVSQFNQAIFDKATENYRKLLALDPAKVMARTNLGTNLSIQGLAKEAVHEFTTVLEHDPNYVAAAGLLLSEKNKIADWEGLTTLRQKVADLLDRPHNTQSVNAFILLSNYDEPAKFLDWARINAKENFANLGVKHPPANAKGRQRERIKIGYFSVDFRNHPVAHLTVPLFELHDKSKFEVVAYSYGEDDHHPVRQRIKNGVENFVNLHGCSLQGMVERIRSDEVDILVDLSGNTRNAKVQVMGHRVAPVQIHWLGFIGTMGSKFYDYTIVDHFVAPEGADKFYDEKLIRMPHCFQINDTARSLNFAPLTREACGLPEGAFVFADFNQSFKIQPEVFEAWIRIVKQVPNSVLWLTDGHPEYVQNVKSKWCQAGLSAERLIFAARVGVNEYLAQYQCIDLFLDAFPYTSGTTASDALWAGCPLLALVGETMVARMSGSILKAACLPELITYSFDEYVSRAVYYANHPQELSGLRQRLNERRLQLPLFDTRSFVKDLENAYTQIAKLAWAGEDLVAIDSRSQAD